MISSKVSKVLPYDSYKEGAFLKIIRKRTAETIERINLKKQRIIEHQQRFVKLMVEFLKVKYLSKILSTIEMESNLGKFTCNIYIDNLGLDQEKSVKILKTFTDEITSNNELLSGFKTRIRNVDAEYTKKAKELSNGLFIPEYMITFNWKDATESYPDDNANNKYKIITEDVVTALLKLSGSNPNE